MPRKNRTKGQRKREAIARRDAERELRELEKEIHEQQQTKRRTKPVNGNDKDHQIADTAE